MKRYPPIVLVLALLVYLSVTGFQCGSAELTTAKLAIQQKQFDKAEQSLMKELAKNDQNEEAWYLLGQVRQELRKYLEANDAYGKALQVNATHQKEVATNRLAMWASLYNDGIASYNKGREQPSYYDSAIVRFKAASIIVPDSANTFYVLGLAEYAKKDFVGAETSLGTALQMKPTYGEAARLLGQIHMNKAVEQRSANDEAGARAEYATAAENYEIAHNADPKNAEYIVNLIECYEGAGESAKALALTRDAVDSDPNNPIYRYAYGVFLLKQDDFGSSIEQFKKCLDLDSSNTDATYNTGVAYLNWGVAMKTESEKKAEEQRQKGKGMKDIKEDMSYKEKFKEAVPFLEKSTKLRQGDALLWQQLARVYANLNMKEKAKGAFEKADALVKSK
jgi:tetratricopeptide (TPR) repeat protein